MCEERKCSTQFTCEDINSHCDCNCIYDAKCLNRRPWYPYPYNNNCYFRNYYFRNYYYGYCDPYLMELLNSDRGNIRNVRQV